MEELLKKILAGQEKMEKQLNNLVSDVPLIKEVVNRIERHQEDTIMGMLSHIKKQVEMKESQIQVLNKRLFEVESKTEHIQQ
ncbi:hypothetical protein NDK43_21200 [Neobacillus pocheonensis]|uniref:Uncharacterized protein n=1 Tax=Neobacillus pocheonensis TaxID=363869 RepID=A0ABT0WEC1_9BACI|nr:hypothetical protein [Neobacillus pocheonensis]